FRTQRMIRCGQRRIGSKTAQAMCTWSHFCFQQHLAHKARGFKVFCCPKCKTELDRDINDARNILLHYLTKKN
ncbi:657_t:CDS:2, partial [Racocetra persica]